MTEIKSALEIALERTKDIKGDKESLKADERKNAGRRLASSIIDPHEDEGDAVKKLKEYKGQELAWVQEGFFQTLLANLSLPSDDSYRERLKTLEKGLNAVVKDKRRVSYIFQQLEQFFQQYLQTKEQVGQNLKQQYAPRLKEKEEALAKQLGGQSVHLAPESDPEFVNLLSKNLARLDEQYHDALRKLKEDMKQLIG